eukprot:CAMPEP_0185910338 /NCGR_PEP_ID=MMETSP0196C-20130402/18668_1 /TAXON_ID=2932 /ORGANISM="Alexandrium fundyense, Strain CCMP1719" /LENGTH=86 /DNA_ID=CAMNT_0028631055 /DNA_START=150 /DNA_END=410 /DNA_ORIENTATION=-
MAVLSAVVLEGCGCDAESVQSCQPLYVESSDPAGTCSTFNSWVQCVKDAECCDYEENGVQVRASINTVANSIRTACEANGHSLQQC